MLPFIRQKPGEKSIAATQLPNCTTHKNRLRYLPVLLVFLFGCQQKNTYVMKSSATFDDLTVKLSITPDTKDSSWVTLVITNNLPLNRYYISKFIDVTWDDELHVLKLMHLATTKTDSASMESLGLFLKRSHSYTINKRIENRFKSNTYVSLIDVSITKAEIDPRDTTDFAHRKPRLEGNMGSFMIAPRNFDHKKATDTAVYLFMDGVSGMYLDATLEVRRKKDGTALLALHMRNESTEFPISTGMQLNTIWDKERNELSISVAPRIDLDEDGMRQQVIQPGATKTIKDSVPDYFNANTDIVFGNIHYLLKSTPDPVTGLRPIQLDALDMHKLGATFSVHQ